jgi:endonuclease G, mitochondrial
VAGPVGAGGEGKKGDADTIAKGKVVVPAKTWKVILVVNRIEDEADALKWVDQDARMIAVMMPNDTSVVFDNWGKYRCTVADVEKATGYSFFDNADPKIINPLKNQVDKTKPPKLPHGH